MAHMARPHLRGAALGSGLLGPPGASLPRLIPLVGRAARFGAVIAAPIIKRKLLQEAALQEQLCAPLRPARP